MNILIVEDEALAARRLLRLTNELLGTDRCTVHICGSIPDAEQYLTDNVIDLLLLDLNLSGENGFDLLSRFTSGAFHTIIVSASFDQALTAFEYGVIDFVPKPFTKERLQKAFNRFEAERVPNGSRMKYLSVKNQGAIRLIPIENVRYFKGADDYVEIHLIDGSYDLYSKSMDSLIQLLPDRFIRIHKSYIADISLIKQVIVHGGGKYEAELSNETILPVSRSFYPALKEKLESIR
jgi:two-component system, LytTR family, response regulator LytT